MATAIASRREIAGRSSSFATLAVVAAGAGAAGATGLVPANVAAGAARPDGAQPSRASARVPRGPVAPTAPAPAATTPGGGTRRATGGSRASLSPRGQVRSSAGEAGGWGREGDVLTHRRDPGGAPATLERRDEVLDQRAGDAGVEVEAVAVEKGGELGAGHYAWLSMRGQRCEVRFSSCRNSPCLVFIFFASSWYDEVEMILLNWVR